MQIDGLSTRGRGWRSIRSGWRSFGNFNSVYAGLKKDFNNLHPVFDDTIVSLSVLKVIRIILFYYLYENVFLSTYICVD
jgi:hypothetical protein